MSYIYIDTDSKPINTTTDTITKNNELLKFLYFNDSFINNYLIHKNIKIEKYNMIYSIL